MEVVNKVCDCEQFELKDGRLMLIIDKDCPNKQKLNKVQYGNKNQDSGLQNI